jgi:chitinase
MASTPEKRENFIKNLLTFLPQYGFDGVDIDWEYPSAEDRGGRPCDKENFTKLLQEMKQAFEGRYLVTFAAPMSSWYLRGYDLKGASEAADWIHVMAYDIHGTWESHKQALGHTNLSDINKALDIFLQAGVSPNKLVLGTAFYGRSYKLADARCTTPGCMFTDGGDQGPCSKTDGYLSYNGKLELTPRTLQG